LTDQDIISLAYDYADCFTSGIVFKDEQLVDFARALLGASVPVSEPEPEPEPFYKDPQVEVILEQLRSRVI
jgi:hypothetical protein